MLRVRKTGVGDRSLANYVSSYSLMVRYYTYRLFPTDEQKQLLVQYTGCARWAYNKALTMKMQGSVTGTSITSREVENSYTEDRITYPWLKKCPIQVLRMAARQVMKDWKDPIPVWYKKGRDDKLIFPGGIQIKYRQNTISIPKVGKISFVYERKVGGTIKEVIVYKSATGIYYARVAAEGRKEPSPVQGTSIAVVKGVNILYALSDGKRVSEPVRIQQQRQRVQRIKRELQRKQSQSSNRDKCKKRLLHAIEKLNNQERDYMHKITTKLVSEHAHIIVDDTSTLLARMLMYKCKWYGNKLSVVPKCRICYSTCSSCGIPGKVQGVSWKCEKCGTVHNSNHNNAINIKGLGTQLSSANGG